jgi:hypothetical protein
MKKAVLRQKLTDMVNARRNLEQKFDALYQLFGENELEDVAWKGWELAWNYLEELAEDKHQVIGAFLVEGRAGKDPDDAKVMIDDVEYVVTTIEDVVELVGEKE